MLIWLVVRNQTRQTWLVFLWFVFYLGTSLPWLVWPLSVPGEQSFLWAVTLWAALIVLHGLIYAAAYVAVIWGKSILRLAFRADVRPWSLSQYLFVGVQLAVAIGLADLLRTLGPLAVPWGYVGYSQVDNPLLRGLFPIGGVYLVSATTSLLAGLVLSGCKSIFEGSQEGGKRFISLTLLLVAVTLCLMTSQIAWTKAAGDPISVRVVHTHLLESRKFDQDVQTASQDLLLDLAGASDVQLTIFPELFLVRASYDYDKSWRHNLLGAVQRSGNHVLVGMPNAKLNEYGHLLGSTNALVHIDPSGRTDAYAKQNLIPFAEAEVKSAWLARLVHGLEAMPSSNFVHSGRATTPLHVGEIRLAPSICSEIAAPATVHQHSAGAHLLLNAASESWIVHPSLDGLMKKALQARAMEAGKVLLRSANVGISGHVSPQGRIHQVNDLHQIVQIQPMTGSTPFSRWAAWPAR